MILAQVASRHPDKGKNKGRQNTDIGALSPLPDNYELQPASAVGLRFSLHPLSTKLLHLSEKRANCHIIAIFNYSFKFRML